jgi:hypothetical protein
MRVYSGNHNEYSSIVARNMKLVVGGFGGGGGGMNLSSDIVRDTSVLSKTPCCKLS